jgi:phage tail sheath gpL-like
MPISFSNISSSYRASKIFIELAGTKKSLSSLFIPPTGMIIGMYDPTKTSVVDYVPVKVTSSDDVGLKAGFGSHAHRQALQFPASVFLQGGGVYWMPIPEESGGTAASETVTFSGTSTSAGTLFFGIGGELVQVAVANGTVAADIAQDLEDEITATRDIAVTGSASAAITTLEAKFKGTQGNQLLVILNPDGESQEDENPSGITVTLGESDGYLAGGATDPDIESAFFDASGNDILGDRWYTHITMPFVDSTNIGHYETLASLRSDPAVNRFFGAYAGYVKDTYSEALVLPAAINNKYIGQIWENRYYGPEFELSAALIGIMLNEQNEAPSRPYATIEIGGMFNADTANRRYIENDALFRAGMSYCNIVAGSLQLGDIALTYRTNSSGGSATDWFDAVSLHRRQAKAYSIEELFKTETYQRAVVVSDTDVTAVDFTIAPKDVIADLAKLISELWVPYGWTKNGDEVIAALTAEINSSYESRIDAQITDDEAQALRQIAVKYAFLY